MMQYGRSCFELGQYYQYDHPSAEESHRYYYQSAILNQNECSKTSNQQECRELGTMYFYGFGVPLNVSKAVVLYQQTCEQKDSEACLSLSELYSTGINITKDENKAQILFEKACSGGFVESCNP